jgi:hypothetical protein
MRQHAILSASSAHRWLHCTKSARLEESFENTSSTFAEEGTFMHELGELKLRRYLGEIKESDYKKKLKELQASPYFNSEIEEAVEVYVSFAKELIEDARKRCKDPLVLLEQRLDFSNLVESGFGTDDFLLMENDYLTILDLKGGQGVKVNSEQNPQMQLYALGALNLFDCLYDITTVRMIICQPRLENISTYEIPVEELLSWAENVLKPAAKLAWEGEGEFCPSDYTCKFCRAKATCKARAEKNLEIAKFEFKQASLLTKEEIIEILTKVDEITAWCKDIWSCAEARALEGEEFDGFKVVEGRSIRTYGDENAVIAKLTEAGYSEDEVFTRSLKGITALEKTLGKKVFAQVLDGLIVKPQGKPTLVPSSDKRDPITLNNAAEADFKEEI